MASFDFERMWSEFNYVMEEYWPSEKTSILTQIAKYSDEEGDKNKAVDMQKEWNLLNRIVTSSKEQIPDIWGWCISNLGQPFPEWNASDTDYYKKRIGETPSTLHKARYAYAIWALTKSDIEYARLAVTNFFETAKTYGKMELDINHVETMEMCFQFAFNLASAISMPSPYDPKTIFTNIFSTLKYQLPIAEDNIIVGTLTDLVVNTGKDLLSKKQFKSDDSIKSALSETIEIAKVISKKFEEKGNYEIEQNWLKKVESVWYSLGNVEEAKKTKQAIAESILKRAETAQNSALLHSTFLEAAVKIYSELGMPDKVKVLSEQIEQDIQLATAKGEFKGVSQTITFPLEDIVKKYLEGLVGMNPEKILAQLTLDDSYFIPKLEDVENRARELKNKFPLQYHIPIKEYEGTIPIRSIEDEAKIFNAKVNTHFLIETQLHRSILSHILSLLIPDRIQREDIVSYLSGAKNISSEDLKLISRSLQHYYTGDYVAFCHIAMPRIEQELKSILKRNDRTATRYDAIDNGLDQKLMGGLVRDLKPYIDKNLHKYVEVWYTQEGQNLRNKISHGWLTLNEFDKRMADLLLYTLIKLSNV